MATKQDNIQTYIAERFKPSAIEDMAATAGTASMILVPQTMGEAMEFAKLMAVTTAVPPHLRGKPGDCLAVTMQAMRWRMDPFAVANKSYFVNDRLAYESQLVNAVVYAHAPLEGRLVIEYDGEGEAMVCSVTGHIKDDSNPHTVVQEIKTITTRNSPLWKQAPRQQLGYFTTREWARLYAPDVILGVYTPDEMDADWRYQGADRAKDVTPRPQRSDYVAADGEVVPEGKSLRQHYVEQAEARRAAEMDAQFAATTTGRMPEDVDEAEEPAKAASTEPEPSTEPEASEGGDVTSEPEMHPYEQTMREELPRCLNLENIDAYWAAEEENRKELPEHVLRAVKNIYEQCRAKLEQPEQAALGV